MTKITLVTFDIESVDKIRELRLWHWRMVIDYSNEVATRKAMGDRSQKMHYANALYSLHMRFVQTLNDFFPADDTAEKDAAK